MSERKRKTITRAERAKRDLARPERYGAAFLGLDDERKRTIDALTNSVENTLRAMRRAQEDVSDGDVDELFYFLGERIGPLEELHELLASALQAGLDEWYEARTNTGHAKTTAVAQRLGRRRASMRRDDKATTADIVAYFDALEDACKAVMRECENDETLSTEEAIERVTDRFLSDTGVPDHERAEVRRNVALVFAGASSEVSFRERLDSFRRTLTSH